MASDTFRFVEEWNIPGATPEEVYDVLARGELLPKWWKGVYLEAEPFEHGVEPRVGSKTPRQGARLPALQAKFCPGDGGTGA